MGLPPKGCSSASEARSAQAGARQHARAGGGAADTTTQRPRLGGRDRGEAAEGEGQGKTD